MTQNKAPETMRPKAYDKWLMEVTENGNARLDNMLICLNGTQEQIAHFAAQINMAFQAGWSTRSDLVQAKIDAAVAAAYERCAVICDERKLSPNRNWSPDERAGYENAVCDMQIATASAIRAALIRESE